MVQTRAPVTYRMGSRVSGSSSEYAFVVDMFRQLKAYDEDSRDFRRQRDAIVTRCLPLADHIARRYSRRGEPLDDLIQVARLGLLNAVRRYDIDSGSDFLAFAVPTVMGEIRRHFRDHGWALKVPRRCKDMQPKLSRAREELSHKLGRAPNASELAEHLSVDRDLVIDTMVANSNYTVLSTDAKSAPDDDHVAIGTTLGVIDPGIDKVLQVETVRPMIAALPEQQRTILTLRFFEDMTQTQIAEDMGISQMHVSRLLAKALETLRSQIRKAELAATG